GRGPAGRDCGRRGRLLLVGVRGNDAGALCRGRGGGDADLPVRGEQTRRGAGGARVRASVRDADRLPAILHGVRAAPAPRSRDPPLHRRHRPGARGRDARGRIERARLHLYYGCGGGHGRGAGLGGAPARPDVHRVQHRWWRAGATRPPAAAHRRGPGARAAHRAAARPTGRRAGHGRGSAPRRARLGLPPAGGDRGRDPPLRLVVRGAPWTSVLITRSVTSWSASSCRTITARSTCSRTWSPVAGRSPTRTTCW